MFIAYQHDHEEAATFILGAFSDAQDAVDAVVERIKNLARYVPEDDVTRLHVVQYDADIVQITYDPYEESEWFVEPLVVHS